MQNLARELGVADYVTFTGRVPDAELLAMLNTADVCVNPDVANEMNDISTMNKIMEYMALGKPIVQFDLAEGRFSAQDASLYAKKNDPVDFAAKIVELLDDPEKRKRDGRLRPPARAGRARVALRGAEAPRRLRRAVGEARPAPSAARHLRCILAGPAGLVLVERFASNAQRNPKRKFQRMNHALPQHLLD